MVNHAAFFVSHRLPLAVAARAAGHELVLITGQAGSPASEVGAIKVLSSHAIEHHATTFTSSGMNPFTEWRGFYQLILHLHRARADVVHCASPKALLYGGIAARIVLAPSLVLAVSGMGYLFTSNKRGVRKWAGSAYSILSRFAYGHRNKRVIVQNQDDHASVIAAGHAAPHEVVLLPGSGVPLEEFADIDDSLRENVVVLPARLLRDKGVVEFVLAAAELRHAGIPWRFVLVGTADYRSPAAIPEDQIRQWCDSGAVEWWGHVDDMLSVYRRARIVCLPSYREGMPKVLLEAAAAGCAVVTTNVVGCREAILDGVTGDLVPAHDAAALATVLHALIMDPVRVLAYGAAGRRLASEKFGLTYIVDRTLSMYSELQTNTNSPVAAKA